MAVLVGLAGGLLLLALAASDLGFGPARIDRSGRLSIQINGVSQRMSRDVYLPTKNWVLQVNLTDPKASDSLDDLVVILRSERTGATIEIQDRFEFTKTGRTLIIPKELGLAAGLLSVRAILTGADGKHFEELRRIRVRSPLGILPIGRRQVIHFDFQIDHDANGLPDFHEDLERFGLASREHPEAAFIIAGRIEARALRRVESAYDAEHDPNHTGRSRDPVTVYFRKTEDPAALVTTICVGGRDPSQSEIVGHVRFDIRNEDKTSTECGLAPAAGLFPAELAVYRDSELYREVLSAFDPTLGGKPIGEDRDDVLDVLRSLANGTGDSGSKTKRLEDINRAIKVFGDVLGSIMAHEAGHALGLVAPGKPSVGLFGGSQEDVFAHNIDPFEEASGGAWLMDSGRTLSFEQLAGGTETGPLRFRPLNYAYLRDRVIVTDER